MSALAAMPAMPAENDAPPEAGTAEATKEHDDEPKGTFLPLSADLDATANTGNNDALHDSLPESNVGVSTNSLSAAVTTDTTSMTSGSRIKPKPAAGSEPEHAVDNGRERANTSSSVWSTAAAALKNLVIGKSQPPPTGIVTVVPAPGAAGEMKPNATSPSAGAKVDKGKGKAVPRVEEVLPLNQAPSAPSFPTQNAAPAAKSRSQSRSSAPPPRLSSIAHSLPTSHATIPPSPPPSQQSSTASPSIQSPQSATSHASGATGTSTTTATDEENQAAALAALNAVIHSVGTGYTQPLTTRAAQLHANDIMLAQQREKLLDTTNLLAKDTAALQKLALESNNKLKSFGDLKNWSEGLDNDLNAIEETLRIVDRGTLELCAKCEEGISEEEGQRWCGVCGKGFHEACAPPSPPPSSHYQHQPGLGDDFDFDGHEEGQGEEGLQHLHQHPHDLPLPDSLPDTVSNLQPPQTEAALGTTPPTLPFSQPSVPKPSSMFEWGGIPDAIKDIAALRGHDDTESEGSGSEWSGDDWRCQECRLKDDLDGIVMGL